MAPKQNATKKIRAGVPEGEAWAPRLWQSGLATLPAENATKRILKGFPKEEAWSPRWWPSWLSLSSNENEKKVESGLRGTTVTARWVAVLAMAVIGQDRQSGHRLGAVACVGLSRQFGGHSRPFGRNSAAIPGNSVAILAIRCVFAGAKVEESGNSGSWSFSFINLKKARTADGGLGRCLLLEFYHAGHNDARLRGESGL